MLYTRRNLERAEMTRKIVLGQVKGKKEGHSTSLSRYDMNILQGAVVGTTLAPPVSTTNLFVIISSPYPLPLVLLRMHRVRRT